MRFVLTVAAVAVLAGCGGGDGRQADTGPADTPPASVPAEPVSVEEALAGPSRGPLLVEGALLVEGTTVRLCSGFAESHPPQCMEPALVVEGFQTASLGGAQKAGRVRWLDDPIQLLGTVEGETLNVSGTAL